MKKQPPHYRVDQKTENKITEFYTNAITISIQSHLDKMPLFKTATQLLKAEIKNRDLTPAKFQQFTYMTGDMYREILAEKTSNPGLITILSICVGLGVPYEDTLKILNAGGHALSATNFDHNIYHRLIMTELGPNPIQTFNNVCENFYVPTLGKRDNRHRKLDE